MGFKVAGTIFNTTFTLFFFTPNLSEFMSQGIKNINLYGLRLH